MPVAYARRAESPEISVVIPSVPANDHSGTVERLAVQDVDAPYEVLVVDDDDLDRSAARNVGLHRSSAPIVALTDDDTRPPADWLRRILAAFSADPDLVCLEGRVFGGSRYRGTRHYVGCNLAVRRDAALAVGGFNSRFSPWREDTEFGWRMERDAPGRCAYDDSIRMCHPDVPRTPIDRRTERRLRTAYPERYATILDATARARLRRWARVAGLTRPINRARNVIRRSLIDGPCP